MSARAAVFRWARRSVPREWRQQTLVVSLLVVAVAVLIAGSSFVYNLPNPPSADFGHGNAFVTYSTKGDGGIARVTAVTRAFADSQTITHRFVQIPGSIETLDLRGQDPTGQLGAPILSLLGGRFAANASEVAVTDRVASTFEVAIGDVLTVGAMRWRVVGLVENPGNTEQEFALTTPSPLAQSDETTVIVSAPETQLDAFQRSHDDAQRFQRPPHDGPLAAALALVLASALLLLVCLVALAGFAVIGQRRLRQVGMLGAIGATEKHRRLVMLANGVVVGAIGVVIGAPLGFAIWTGIAPLLVKAAAHRVDRFSMPWGLVAVGCVMAVVASAIAAWWPGRALGKTPIVDALSARPSRPKPAHRTALVGLVVTIAGVVCFALADQEKAVFIIAGTVLIAIGVPSIAPLGIRALASFARRAPFTIRLALRDLARYQSRSAAALASISLAIGIAMTIVILASSAIHPGNDGNLAAKQLMIRTTPARDPLGAEPDAAARATIAAASDRIAARLGRPKVVDLQIAVTDLRVVDQQKGADGQVTRATKKSAQVDPSRQPRIGLALGKPRPVAGGVEISPEKTAKLYIATASVLRYFHIDPSVIRSDTDVVTTRTDVGSWEFLGAGRGMPRPHIQVVAGDHRYSSLPRVFITEAAVRRLGLETAAGAWIIDGASPLTTEQINDARKTAASAGVEIETRDERATLRNLRNGAMVAGAVLALAILSMTVGLIRADASGDLRVLLAAGGTSRVRRGLTAVTSSSLALVGAVIGTAGAYIAIAAWYGHDLHRLTTIPWLYLGLAILVLPAIAAVTGWLGAWRAPAIQSRQTFD